jgi:hypothetical protein
MSTTAQRMAEYEEALRKAQAYDPNAFQNEFEKSYGEATNYNKDLIEQQAQALGEVQAVAPTLREKYMNTLITDPTAQMALIAQARQAPIQSYGTAANLLTARGQRYQDILGKALGGYQTAAQQAQMDAENRWRLYQDAVQQDQFNRQLSASRGNGTQNNGIADILKMFMGGGETEQAPVDQGLLNKQKVLDSINSIRSLRSTKNIEKQMPAYYKEILNQAKQLGLNVNTEALWQQLGNDVGVQQTLKLFL